MTLHEPMTFATDLILGALTAVFAVKLLRRAAAAGSPALRSWGLAFVGSAAAAATGGFYHGFLTAMPPLLATALWKVTVMLVGVTSYFLLRSALQSTLSASAARPWLFAAAMKFGVYAAWMTTHDEFRYVIYDYGSAMLAVAGLQLVRMTRGADGAGFILGGIGVSFAAAAVQHSGYALHPQFNHNDLYHVIQMGATALLYAGGLSLRGTVATPV